MRLARVLCAATRSIWASEQQNNISGTSESYLRQDTANISECQVLHAGRRYREENSTNNLLGDHLGRPDACNK
jgi:hypothetical protein